jgi:two-component system, response regulator PdtaR
MTGETILVVEDEGLIALHMTEMLEKAGYRITGPAYSGEMALREFMNPPFPDLVLMDIALAGKLDGIETARQIRKQFPALPLIFVTAYSPERTVERMREFEPDGVIVKPFKDTDLLALMEKALHR